MSAKLISEVRKGSRKEVNWIVVDFGPGAGSIQHDADGLLARFVTLHDAPPKSKRILAFARKYGIPDVSAKWRQFLTEPGDSWGMKVSMFRQYAGLLHAALRTHRRLQTKERLPERSDVKTVREFLSRHGLDEDRYQELRHEYAEHDVPRVGPGEDFDRWCALQRGRVMGVANWWLAHGKVQPRAVMFPTGRFGIRWTGGLWGVLGGQLIYALRREENVAVCDYCDQEFRLGRRPREGAQARCCKKQTCQRKYRRHRMQQTRARKRGVTE